jgi:hypothetical protein
MRSLLALFSFRNRTVYISLILIPLNIYEILGGHLQVKGHPVLGLSLVVIFVAAFFALVFSLTCWIQVFVEMYRNDTLPINTRFLWSVSVLVVPYGLILYYYRFHKPCKRIGAQ